MRSKTHYRRNTSYLASLAAAKVGFAVALAIAFNLSAAPAATFHICKFNTDTLLFGGSPAAQASCLMAHRGASAPLPRALATRIGRNASHLRDALRNHLRRSGIDDASIGGSIDDGFARARAGHVSLPLPRYFVIHDTAAPVFRNRSQFPRDINRSAAVNDLARYLGPEAVVHVFVDRMGRSRTGHDFAEPWRATRFEMRVMRDLAFGKFLHVELVQPRRTDSRGRVFGPAPAFTRAQYDRLALVYAAASVRAGHWLIPAFHSRIDHNHIGAHTDPRGFSVQQFGRSLGALLSRLGASG